MAQFDVYANPERARARELPYLVDVQSALLARLATRVAIPLLARDAGPRVPLDGLTPPVAVLGRTMLLCPQFIAVYPVRDLGTPLANLESQRVAIIRAIDFVLSGV